MPDEILDPPKRFSESLLWKLQENAYQQFGPTAWSEKGVPFYLTSNPWTTEAYFQVVWGFLLDLMRLESLLNIDVSQPITVFDLGAGSGRFAYLFLKEWEKVKELSPLKIRYVVTDIVKENLEFCLTHKQLLPYVKEGILDGCYYDPAKTKESLHLIASGDTFSRKSNRNPIICIGNYFFDTIPQELFKVDQGQLLEGFITLKVPSEIRDRNDPAWIENVRCEYSYHRRKQGKELSDDPLLHKLLEEHAEELNEGTFLFPIGAFQTIRFFRSLSKGAFLLLAGDQAVSNLQQLQDWPEPELARHGSFSLPVSYFTLQRYFQHLKGSAYLPDAPDRTFSVFTGVLHERGPFTETAVAYKKAIGIFDPFAYWKLIQRLEEQFLTVDELMALIRLGRYDPITLHANFQRIRSQIERITADERNQLLFCIDRVYDNFYPICKADGDFVLNLGVLCFELKNYLKALEYFKRALQISGPSDRLANNIKTTQSLLQDLSKSA